MTFTRRDVWGLGAGWSDPLLWYARAVKRMRGRDITDVTSWTFLAAMHGIDAATWQAFKYLDPAKPAPSQALQRTYWNQCQHQSWYFLPWHRGYLWSFETIVRAAVVSLGGPADWALPYWNYNNTAIPRAAELPPAFAAKDWPDDHDLNPLYTPYRYGRNADPIVLPASQIRPVAQRDDQFTGGSSGAKLGFGGPKTLFHHGGEDNAPNGGLESEPHNNVHGLVGGQILDSDPNLARNYGLMSIPDQAALDPIFWLHHANIDRLWTVWLNGDPHRQNPTDKAWRNGPASRVFAVPDASGNKVTFTPTDMLDTRSAKLGYVYEDETNPKPPPGRQARLMNLGASPTFMAEAMAKPPAQKPAEVFGATEKPINLAAGERSADVRLDAPAKAQVAQSFDAAAAPAEASEPDRVFLELDNIRGVQEAALVEVHVGPPGSDDTSPDSLAGTISGFGLTKATRKGPRNGLTQVFDISEIVDRLHLQGDLAGLQHLHVTFVPVTPLDEHGQVTVGAIKILRQPQ